MPATTTGANENFPSCVSTLSPRHNERGRKEMERERERVREMSEREREREIHTWPREKPFVYSNFNYTLPLLTKSERERGF